MVGLVIAFFVGLPRVPVFFSLLFTAFILIGIILVRTWKNNYLNEQAARFAKEKALEAQLATRHDAVVVQSTDPSDDTMAYLSTVLNSFIQALYAYVGTLLLYDDDKKRLTLAVSAVFDNDLPPIEKYSLAIGEEVAGRAAEAQKPIIFLDTEEESLPPNMKYEKYLSGTVLGIPLFSGEKLLGVLNIAKKAPFLQQDNPLTKSDLANIKALENELTRGILDFHLKKELEGIAISTVRALVKALQTKDPYTKHHSENVAWYSALVAKELNISSQDVRDIIFACQLHDLGKIAIDDAILTKKGPLNPQEWETMKTHPTLGEDMLKPISSLKQVATIIGQEHERYDGKGYPRGLKGKEILLTSQIVSVADAFDVITSKRSYKEAQSVEFALAEISRCSGSQFNPTAVHALIEAVNNNYSALKDFMGKSHDEGYVARQIQLILDSLN